jgi:hypothetical protein
MRRLTAISLAMLLCFAVAACGGDDKEDASTKGSTTTSADRQTDDSADDDGRSADDQALEAKLLTVEDVGPQWTVEYSSADGSSDDDSADDEEDDDSGDPECLQQLDDIESADSAAEADITFSRGEDDDTELSQEIDSYEGNLDGAHDEFDQAAGLLDGCGEFSMDLGGGTQGRGSITRIDDVHYGDQSGIWEISIEAAGVQYTEAVAIVFVDDLTVNFSLGQSGPDAAQDLRPYIEKGLAKL